MTVHLSCGLRPAGPGDAAAIAAMYNYYVEHTAVTFETEAVAPSEIARRIEATAERDLPWLVSESAGVVQGYAYAQPWKPRQAYAPTVETSVYVAPARHRRGLGRQLLEALIAELSGGRIHCALAGIAQPNEASVRLHESLGFVYAGTLRQVGHKLGRWIDVGYWQRIFEDA